MGPLRPAIGAALRSLHLPAWNPWEGAGQPLLAQLLNGVLHPASIATALLGDSADLLVVLLFALAAAGAWVAARSLGASPMAALASGLAFGLSGFVLGMASNTQYLMSAASGPWAVAGLVATARRPGGWAWGAAGVAALLLCGDPGGAIAFGLMGLALAGHAGGWRGLGPALGAGVLGAGLAAVQLLPSALHLADTSRGLGLAAGDLHRWALAPWRILELAAPGFLVGRPESYVAPVYAALDGASPDRFPFVPSAFVGAATLALAAAGALRPGWASRAAGLAAVFLWLALGFRAGSQQLLSWVPVWGALRYWEKMLAPFTLCAALAAAGGVDALAAGLGQPARRIALGALAVAAALALAFAVPGSGALLGLDGSVAELARTRLLVGLAHATAALAALAGATVLARTRPTAAAGLAAAILGLAGVAASPFALHAGSRAALDATPPPLAAEAPGPRVVAPLGCDYAAGVGELDPIDLLNLCERRTGRPATNAAAGVQSLAPYTGLASTRWELVAGSGPLFWPIARRLATTHVLARPPASAVEAQVLGSAVQGLGPPALLDGGGLLVWALPHRPWASFARAARTAPDPRAALAELARELAAGGEAVVVETAGSLGPFAEGTVLAIDHGAEQVTVTAEAGGDGLLVVADAWAPGWRASIDGREVELLPADLLARAVRWPAGRHVLVMRYEAPGLAMGAGLSLATLLGMAGFALLRRRSRLRAATPG